MMPALLLSTEPSLDCARGTSRGSMTRSVMYQMTGRNTSVMATMKKALPAILASQVGRIVSAAASVMPNSSASSCPGNRLAEKPPETPANAAAMPAMGCLPAAANITPASGISTT